VDGEPAKDLDAVLRDLRHDLRSPLAVIVGFADVIANRATLGDDERRDYAARIGEAAGEIRDLLDDALG
jgi:signal transduction histidine kinase